MNQLLAVNISETPLGNTTSTLGGTYSNISVLISIILKNSFAVISIILLIILISGGITFIMSAGSGDSKKAEKAKGALTSALIGFAIVFCAYFIIQIIQIITGLNILNPGF